MLIKNYGLSLSSRGKNRAMKTIQHYQIKDLVKQTGLTADSIRFYEKKKLIEAPLRGENNYRYYDHEALKRLVFIKRCRALDMSLKEIEQLIELEQQSTQNCGVINDLIDQHLLEIKNKISELKKFQQQLQALRNSCSSQTTIDHCQILKQLEATD